MSKLIFLILESVDNCELVMLCKGYVIFVSVLNVLLLVSYTAKFLKFEFPFIDEKSPPRYKSLFDGLIFNEYMKLPPALIFNADQVFVENVQYVIYVTDNVPIELKFPQTYKRSPIGLKSIEYKLFVLLPIPVAVLTVSINGTHWEPDVAVVSHLAILLRITELSEFLVKLLQMYNILFLYNK